MMITFRNEILVPVAPPLAWSVLSDLEGFKTWHPFVDIEGGLTPGGLVRYTYRGAAKPRTAEMKVVDVEPGVSYTLRTNAGPLIVWTEGYHLHAANGGTTVQHWIECRGWILIFIGRSMAQRIRDIVQRSDTALTRRLSGRKGTPLPPRASHQRPRHPRKRR